MEAFDKIFLESVSLPSYPPPPTPIEVKGSNFMWSISHSEVSICGENGQIDECQTLISRNSYNFNLRRKMIGIFYAQFAVPYKMISLFFEKTQKLKDLHYLEIFTRDLKSRFSIG